MIKVFWPMSVTAALRKQRQKKRKFKVSPRLYNQFQARTGFIVMLKCKNKKRLCKNKNSTHLPALHTNIEAYSHRDWFTEYHVLSERSIINNFPTSTLVVLVCLCVGRRPCRDVQKSEGAIRMLSSITSLPYILRLGSH